MKTNDDLSVVIVTIATLGVIVLDEVCLNISILRGVISFIYLTFVPGFVLVRTFRLHSLSEVELLLHTIGLSLTFIMYIGVSINIVYYFLNVSKPLSTVPVALTIGIGIVALWTINSYRNKGENVHYFARYGDMLKVLRPPGLFILLFPLMSIIGCYLVNVYKSNIILLSLIIAISSIPILVTANVFLKRFYPLLIAAISVSLLYFQSLITMYLVGWDVHGEYYLSNLVNVSSYWNNTIPVDTNAMLSVTMLPVIYSKLLNVELTWVYKIIYPLLYSLVPLALYQIYKSQRGSEVGFLSAFFFISLPTFYFMMVSLPRQMIAELFVVLLLIVVANKRMDNARKSFLLIFYGFSIVVSHYGITYVFMLILIATWLISNLLRFDTKFRTITPSFVVSFVVFTLSWYMYNSSSSPFNTIVLIGEHITKSIFTDLLNPMARDYTFLLAGRVPGLTYRLAVMLNLIAQFLIILGIIRLIVECKKKGFIDEISAFSLSAFVILVMCVIIPFFSTQLNIDRIYHFSILMLAPFPALGLKSIFNLVNKYVVKVINPRDVSQVIRTSLRAFSIFLAIFLLFNCGFVNEVFKDHPRSSPLSTESVKFYGDIDDKASFYTKYTMEQDVFSARWLSKNREENIKIYGDLIACDHVLGSYGSIPFYILPQQQQSYWPLPSSAPKEKSYIYLRYFNVVEHAQYKEESYKGSELGPITCEPIEIKQFSEKANKIYTNGGSEIYYSDRQS